jgi:hypothetical protein
MVEALICFDTARRRDAKGRKVVDPLKSIELSHLGDILPVYITSATPAQCSNWVMARVVAARKSHFGHFLGGLALINNFLFR